MKLVMKGQSTISINNNTVIVIFDITSKGKKQLERFVGKKTKLTVIIDEPEKD